MGVGYAELIGDPVAQSKSPLIHKFWLAKLGMAGDYRVARIASDRLHRYLRDRRGDPDWLGCNVTMPHKRAAVAFMDRLGRSAERCRAVNTIVAEGDRRLVGRNTDALAVADLLRSRQPARYPGHVATYVQVVGAGGAAWAAVIGAADAGYIDFEFYNRTVAKAQALAVRLGLDPQAYAAPIEALGPIRNPDDGPDDQRYSHVVINATSRGMTGFPELEADLSRYYPDTVILDMPYKPGGTAFAKAARALGLPVIDGFDMLTSQAAPAFEAFFGVPAPRRHDLELRELLTS